jgi:hypothetical protein
MCVLKHVTEVHPLALGLIQLSHVPCTTIKQPASHPSVGSLLVSNLFEEQVTDVHPLALALIQLSHVPPGTVEQISSQHSVVSSPKSPATQEDPAQKPEMSTLLSTEQLPPLVSAVHGWRATQHSAPLSAHVEHARVWKFCTLM